MNTGYADIFLLAVGVAASATATTMVVLMLMASKGRALALALIAGWVASLALVTVIALALVSVTGVTGRGGPTDAASIARLILGTLLLVLGVLQWRRSGARGKGAAPKWTSAIDEATPPRAFFLGAALGNVKNLILALAAMAALVEGGVGRGVEAAFVVVFVTLGSLGVLVPLIVAVAEGERAEVTLRRWRDWLLTNASGVMTFVAVCLGLLLMVRGAVALWF